MLESEEITVSELRNRRVLLVSAMAVACALVVVLLAITGGAKAGQDETRMTSYRTPTGPELTARAATDRVVTEFAREDGGVLGPLSVTTTHSTFAAAQAVVNAEPPSAAVTGGPADITEWRNSPVYTVVMRAAPGETFKPNVSVPRGDEGPTGQVMSVIIDAHTGQRESLNLEPRVPSRLSELGTAIQGEYPAVSAAQAASLPSGNVGFLVGQLYVSNKPAAGRYVFVGSQPMPRLSTRHKTGQHGVFSFRLAPGRYYVKAGKPNDGFCGATKVTVARHKYTKVNLHCSK
jgi:hypothetical protein